jgi:hypothetical protein
VDEAWNEHGFTAYSWCFWYYTTYHHRLDYDYDYDYDYRSDDDYDGSLLTSIPLRPIRRPPQTRRVRLPTTPTG